MNFIDTIPIAFSVGSYGTYLQWLLTNLTTDGEVPLPFTSQGSSHNFSGQFLNTLGDWQEYVNNKKYSKFVRLHPKNTKDDSLSDNLNAVLKNANKMIYLYPDASTKLLVINNWFSKVWKDWWKHQFNHDVISSDYIYKNWPVDANTKIEDIPVWIKREFLSFYLMPAWYDQVEWYHPDRWQHPRCLIIFVSDLLCNLRSTLNRIQEFCGLEYKKNISELIPAHNLMLSLQANLNQDSICDQIVNNTIAGKEFNWQPLPLASQSWIQWQLRNQNFEIRCHGLDIFPTNSVQLHNLLYSI